MRALSLISTLALVAVLPVHSSSLVPRKNICANDGRTVAGTLLLHHRSVPVPAFAPSTPALHPPRAREPVVWCAPDSTTYLIITFLSQLPGPMILKLLSDAYSKIVLEMAQVGDEVIPEGVFDYSGDGGLNVYTINTNNHQQTYGVLGAAIEGLSHWMITKGEYGAAHFIIFDGENEVGQGTLGLGKKRGRGWEGVDA